MVVVFFLSCEFTVLEYSVSMSKILSSIWKHYCQVLCKKSKMNGGIMLIFRFTATHSCPIALCSREIVTRVSRDTK
jgi:hypothetical protein